MAQAEPAATDHGAARREPFAHETVAAPTHLTPRRRTPGSGTFLAMNTKALKIKSRVRAGWIVLSIM